ncbi:MAG: hypothetical protein E2P02_20720 [Acidobacteria bacterium]|nr:MAG: hypothetical protein E2P02_20720 [Acidobacteriota bacterium]
MSFPIVVGLPFALVLLGVHAETETPRERQAEFLKNADIIEAKVVGKGVTETWRLTLKDDTLTHDASFQYVDEREAMKTHPGGTVEFDFVDSYRYNIAGYELAELLGLAHMVPVSVERRWRGKRGALTWWVDDVLMDEATMNEKGLKAPDQKAWSEQIYRVRVFNELIHDTDRNQGNLLIAKDWKIWAIDFSRAFRRWPKIQHPSWLMRCDRQLFERLQSLTRDVLDEKLSHILKDIERDGIWARRGLILEHYEELIRVRGEDQTLY